MVVKKKTKPSVETQPAKATKAEAPTKKAPALKGVRSNTNTLREKLESAGVGLLSFGSYIAKRVNVDAVEGLSDVPLRHMAPAVMVMSSSKGQLIRTGKADFDSGVFAKDGLRVSKAMFPDGEMALFHPASLLKGELSKRSRAVEVRFNSKSGPETVTGMLFEPEVSGDYATLVVVSKGKVTGTRDVEFRTNKYNAGKVGRIVKELPKAELLPALRATFQ